jgi:hypothetical protein
MWPHHGLACCLTDHEYFLTSSRFQAPHFLITRTVCTKFTHIHTSFSPATNILHNTLTVRGWWKPALLDLLNPLGEAPRYSSWPGARWTVPQTQPLHTLQIKGRGFSKDDRSNCMKDERIHSLFKHCMM